MVSASCHPAVVAALLTLLHHCSIMLPSLAAWSDQIGNLAKSACINAWFIVLKQMSHLALKNEEYVAAKKVIYSSFSNSLPPLL
jgi:hypothetical protein